MAGVGQRARGGQSERSQSEWREQRETDRGEITRRRKRTSLFFSVSCSDMAGSSSTPQTSTPPADPPCIAPIPASSPCLPAAVLSGRVPVNVNGASGGSASGGSACGSACGGSACGGAVRMVEVHGVPVAAFWVSGVELLCLPQVFQLFLRHLVGGLHTVYTKLKRLRLRPVGCSVEQVRALRGLGAIQPGVNRCKLISRADFRALLRDCTCNSSRPGRPPKRTLGVATMTDGSRLLPHGLISPALLPPTGGSEASWEKEQRLLSPPPPSSSSSAVAPHPGSASLNALQQHGALLANRLSDFPFMVMPHPLLPVGLPPASVSMAMNQMSQLSGLANMAVVSHVQIEESEESSPRSPSPCPSPSDDPREPTGQSPSRASSSSSSSPPPADAPADSLLPLPLLKPPYEKRPLTSQPLSFNHANHVFAPLLLTEGLSSMETLLTNMQGVLKMALDRARSQDKHNQLERKALKLELERERDGRQILQRQLSSELQTRVSIQRRLKKEKKAKRKLQEVFDFESRRREQVERALTENKMPQTS